MLRNRGFYCSLLFSLKASYLSCKQCVKHAYAYMLLGKKYIQMLRFIVQCEYAAFICNKSIELFVYEEALASGSDVDI